MSDALDGVPLEDLVPGASNREEWQVDAGKLAESILAGGDEARLQRRVELELNPSSGSQGLPQGYGDPTRF